MTGRGGSPASFPQHGLDSLRAQALLALATALALSCSVLLRRRPHTAFAVLIATTIVTTLMWRQTQIPPLQFLAVDLALGFVTAVLPRRSSLLAAVPALGVLACYMALRLLLWPDDGTASEPYAALTVVIAWLLGNSVHQSRFPHRAAARSASGAGGQNASVLPASCMTWSRTASASSPSRPVPHEGSSAPSRSRPARH